jgi:hypothetical protein
MSIVMLLCFLHYKHLPFLFLICFLQKIVFFFFLFFFFLLFFFFFPFFLFLCRQTKLASSTTAATPIASPRRFDSNSSHFLPNFLSIVSPFFPIPFLIFFLFAFYFFLFSFFFSFSVFFCFFCFFFFYFIHSFIHSFSGMCWARRASAFLPRSLSRPGRS